MEDPSSQALLAQLDRVAPSEASVLIVGESGTGKELIARHLHACSPRARQPFVALNCGAFGQALVDAELFGHEKGAFPGALNARAGWLEEANGGTLFLDDIGDLPMPLQVKLLRVLQEREVVRLGARRSTPVDIRVLAASNLPLDKAIAQGSFRQDLFYRLNVVGVELKPLRQRPGDIVPLIRHFVSSYSQRLGHGPVRVDTAAERRLVDYPWPGNIRELENVIHHALLMHSDGVIRAEDIQLPPQRRPSRLGDELPTDGQALLARAFARLFETGDAALHATVEEQLFRAVYRHCDQNQVRTAALLGVSRNVVRARLIARGELVVNTRSG
ncbi:sigma-54 interaction domain-containing protein [Xanthomonas cannabis]|uniref:sigma-54 interaction domain-containing protein n=1 Tax=Xanthomonas cannabis TaxID=1885674 RepID=UPI0023EE4084|nr:sigma-54 dependent transcriptional regulator [Xanthomonas cannabis]NIK00019.1 DNA-binding NtrC family response regulator [Xanthomonas cannabis]NIK63978.1 DNA-binding NtrC family response regulator [Xanthomonas cannabis]